MILAHLQFRHIFKAIDQDSSVNVCIFVMHRQMHMDLWFMECKNNNSHFIFAKTKLAPMKSKTLSNLELLAAYLAVKALPIF